MYFPDRGCVHTLLTLYVYATAGAACAKLFQPITRLHRVLLSSLLYQKFNDIFCLQSRQIFCPLDASKTRSRRGSSPNTAEGAYSTPQTP